MPEMRVVLVSNGFQPNYEAGFANGLASNGVQVTLVASDETLFARLDPAIEVKNLRGSQDPCRSAAKKAWNLLWYFCRLLVLVAYRRAPTHLTGLSAFANFTGQWANRAWVLECWCIRLFSSRLILTVHNVVPHDRDSALVRHQLARVYRIPHLLVVHTNAACQRLIDEFGIDSVRIAVMDHGIDEIVVSSPDEISATRSASGYSTEDTVVLFLGWVRRYKGLDMLVEACKALPMSFKLLIAGNCKDIEYEEQIRIAVNDPALNGRITWEFGYLSEERVSSVLSAADLLVMPYRKIDQSGVLFAALRHGIPIVAFDVGSFQEYIPAGAGMVVSQGDIKGLALAIEEVALQNLSKAGIQALALRYRWLDTVKTVLPNYH